VVWRNCLDWRGGRPCWWGNRFGNRRRDPIRAVLRLRPFKRLSFAFHSCEFAGDVFTQYRGDREQREKHACGVHHLSAILPLCERGFPVAGVLKLRLNFCAI
jgi:hypothetical protein